MAAKVIFLIFLLLDIRIIYFLCTLEKSQQRFERA